MSWAVLSVASALALVLLAEIMARRWFRRQGNFVRRPWDRLELTLDRTVLPSLETVARFEVNSDGERGDRLPTDREGLYRVLVAGGSAVECALLDQDTAWPAVVQRLLNQPESLKALGARRVYVGNVGRSFTPTDIVFRFLEKTLPRYERLDLILLMVGASDLLKWMELKTPAQMPESSAADNEVFAVSTGVRFQWRTGKLAIRWIAGSLRRRFGPARKRRNGGRRFEVLRRRRQASQLVNAVPDPAPVLDHLDKYLRKAVALAQAKGARVILVRQPWLDKTFTAEEESVMWNFCRGRLCMEVEEHFYFSLDVVKELMRIVDRRLNHVARELGIEQVELMPVLEASLSTYYDMLHFTPGGARAVAEHVANAVLAPKGESLTSASFSEK